MPGIHNTFNSPKNIVRMEHFVTRDDRAIASGDKSKFMGCTIWFTGLSGSGKSTLAFSLERRLVSMGIQAYTLDGDNLRLGLNKDLRFSDDDRAENIRRVAEVARLFADSGTCAITSFISPFEKQRQLARELHEEAKLPFIEVYLSTPLEVCEARDTKSLYVKARRGEIKDFTGISSPYEVPLNPELCLNTAEIDPEECINRLIQILTHKEIIPRNVTDDNICELYVAESEKSLYLAQAEEHPQVALSKTDLQWVQVLAEGWASPLRGFMREAQYLQVLYFGGLIEGRQEFTNLSIPIVLAVTNEDRERLGPSVQHITLTYDSKPVAILLDIEFYAHRKEERCNRIFGICDRGHPVIDQIMSSGDWLVGGDLRVLNPIVWNDGLDQYRLSPRQLRKQFKKIGADAMFAFQLRNPVHNGHALLMRETRRKLIEERGFHSPLLLLHPLGGWTKPDDVPLEVRMRQHQACLLDGVLDPQHTLLAIFPSPMIYAGPREVQWHARCRLVAGVHFYIVGRDPAGLPHPSKPNTDLYDPTHGAKVLSMAPGLKGLEIVPFRVAAYNKVHGAMEIYDSNRADDFIFISGTKMRTLAREGQQPPDGFMSPSAWQVLAEFYSQQQQQQQQRKCNPAPHN